MFRKIYKDAAVANDLRVRFSSATKAKGSITLEDGRQHRFASNDPGLNSRSSVQLAKDKYRCGEALSAAGVSVPKTIILPGLSKIDQEDPERNAQLESMIQQSVKLLVDQVGFPLFIKPNTGSEGRGVYRADDKDSLSKIIRRSRRSHDQVLVQEASSGQEYRVVVLGGKVIMAYQKVPLGLIGDGTSTIGELLDTQIYQLKKTRKLRLQAASPKIDFTLTSLGYSRESILEMGKLIYPIPSANLAQGANPIDKMDFIRSRYADVCERIAKALKIKFMGIDLMVNEKENSYHVIEVNSKPGFGKYAGQSPEHKRRVAEIYEACIYFANTGHVPEHLAAVPQYALKLAA
jgi:glutathione synthase/RimK-type ligase-like ATP-grasp enzyme